VCHFSISSSTCPSPHTVSLTLVILLSSPLLLSPSLLFYPLTSSASFSSPSLISHILLSLLFSPLQSAFTRSYNSTAHTSQVSESNTDIAAKHLSTVPLLSHSYLSLPRFSSLHHIIRHWFQVRRLARGREEEAVGAMMRRQVHGAA
jgi:hypothetical protein